MTAKLLRIGNGWLTHTGFKELTLVRQDRMNVIGWVASESQVIGRSKKTGKLVRAKGERTTPVIILDDEAHRRPTHAAPRGTRFSVDPVTDRQLGLIERLIKRKHFLDAVDNKKMRDLRRRVDSGDLSKPLASQFIKWLKALPQDHREAGERLVDLAPGDLRQDGIYRVWSLGGDDEHPYAGNVYKVQQAVHGSGRLYAKKMVPQKDGTIKWDYREAVYERAVTWLKHKWRLSDGQAKKLGVLYGTCIRCGKTLTAEDSIQRKCGKTCADYIENGDWGRFNNQYYYNQEELLNV